VTARDLTPEAADRVAKEAGTTAEVEAATTTPGGAAEVRLLVPEGRVYPVLSSLEQARATLVSVVPARETLEAAFFRLIEEAA
jgi:hypothetical protein